MSSIPQRCSDRLATCCAVTLPGDMTLTHAGQMLLEASLDTDTPAPLQDVKRSYFDSRTRTQGMEKQACTYCFTGCCYNIIIRLFSKVA